MQLTLGKSARPQTSGGWFLYLFLLVLFGGLSIFGAYQLYQQSELDRRGVETQGVIIERETVENDELEYHLIYLFDGYTGRQRVTEDFYNQYDVMDTLTVTYLPDNPIMSRIQNTVMLRLWYLFIMVVCGALVAMILFATVPRIRRKKSV